MANIQPVPIDLALFRPLPLPKPLPEVGLINGSYPCEHKDAGLAHLTVWVGELGQNYGVSNRQWYITIYGPQDLPLEWDQYKYLVISAPKGKTEICLPPGSYRVSAVWGYYQDDGGLYHGNHFTDSTLITVCCGEKHCVTLYNPTIHRCGALYLAALKGLLAQQLKIAAPNLNLTNTVAVRTELTRQTVPAATARAISIAIDTVEKQILSVESILKETRGDIARKQVNDLNIAVRTAIDLEARRPTGVGFTISAINTTTENIVESEEKEIHEDFELKITPETEDTETKEPVETETEAEDTEPEEFEDDTEDEQEILEGTDQVAGNIGQPANNNHY